MRKVCNIKIVVFVATLVLCSGCNSLLGINQGQGQEQANSNHNSVFSSMDNNDDAQNNQLSSGANLTLKQESSRLPSSFQQPRRMPRQDMMGIFSSLKLSRIEGNTWRTAANPVVVYGIIARLLSQSYIISSVDRKNFNIQTDWDKFFIDGRLFRNRMSVTVFPVGKSQTEVVIKNSVEYYTGTLAKQEENMAWLPSPDLTDEVNKLVENTDRQTAFAYSQQGLRN
ncbi:MAG: hypothetical protein V4591_08305 [Bdellovibrionota bacterium]